MSDNPTIVPRFLTASARPCIAADQVCDECQWISFLGVSVISGWTRAARVSGTSFAAALLSQPLALQGLPG